MTQNTEITDRKTEAIFGLACFFVAVVIKVYDLFHKISNSRSCPARSFFSGSTSI
jgi:hypothetical protein